MHTGSDAASKKVKQSDAAVCATVEKSIASGVLPTVELQKLLKQHESAIVAVTAAVNSQQHSENTAATKANERFCESQAKLTAAVEK